MKNCEELFGFHQFCALPSGFYCFIFFYFFFEERMMLSILILV